MDMKKKELEALDKAITEFFKDGEIKTVCPRCGGKITVFVEGNSYEVACSTENCIKDVIRGI